MMIVYLLVAEATGKVVASAKTGSEMIEDSSKWMGVGRVNYHYFIVVYWNVLSTLLT